MQHSRCASVGAWVAPVLFVAGVASADFIGSTALLEAYYPDLETLIGSWGPEEVVDPGIEFPAEEPFPWDTDVAAATIRLDHLVEGNYLGPADFNGFVLTFTDLATRIEDLALDPSSTLVPTEYWATEDQVFIDYAGPRVIGISSTILNVTFVPGPAASAILVLGVAFARRSQRRRER